MNITKLSEVCEIEEFVEEQIELIQTRFLPPVQSAASPISVFWPSSDSYLSSTSSLDSSGHVFGSHSNKRLSSKRSSDTLDEKNSRVALGSNFESWNLRTQGASPLLRKRKNHILRTNAGNLKQKTFNDSAEYYMEVDALSRLYDEESLGLAMYRQKVTEIYSKNSSSKIAIGSQGHH